MKGYNDLVTLLKETQARKILDTNTAAICDYQDMIAHSDVDKLEELSRGSLKEAFYWVYGAAYGTYEALRFFYTHAEQLEAMRERIADNEAEIEALQARKEEAKKEAAKNMDLAEKNRAAWQETTEDLKQAQKTIEAQAAEIIKLKAKLYDMITK